MGDKSKVFLGGTCNGSTWRAKLKPLLKTPYFDPVVDDWTEECGAIENLEKDTRCDIHLYVITSEGAAFYSVAEAVESAHDKSKRTFFYVVADGFSEPQLASFRRAVALIQRHGGVAGMLRNFENLALLIDSYVR